MRGYQPLKLAVALTHVALALWISADASSTQSAIAAVRSPDSRAEQASPRANDRKKSWPGWIIVPAHTVMTALANHSAGEGEPRFGVADVKGSRSAAETASLYVEALHDAGWTVATLRIDRASADVRRILHLCLVEGTLGPRLLRLSLERGQPRALGSLYWSQGLRGRAIGSKPGTC